ncbi:AtpZ/AtpI family protein [Actinorugispora endophytica]|uniref:ATP synthase protein I n=1 Tax=Actinorugispora endophytica TaxID=1605990 RepID=A0A4R6UQX8_9ACTN|nr:AtpZ/AtpI family protein [Actinorugispora endophytica]TDQ47963.1 ATP synthase protein I [Actinorugispora endophytica]
MSESLKPDKASTEKSESSVDGMSVVSLLMAGMIVWGGIGWLLDRLMDYQGLFLPIGILLGLGLSMYMLFARLRTRP